MEEQHVSLWFEAIFSITISEFASKLFSLHFEKIIQTIHQGYTIVETIYGHNQSQFGLQHFASARVTILRAASRLNCELKYKYL